jgi:hypothetical protein
MLLTGWPTIVDDLGDGKSGTPLNKVSFWDVVKAAIEALVHSATNPLISPAAAIDELVLSRGSLSTLWERLAVALNDDGTLKTQASLVTLADARTSIGKNYFHDDLLLLWPDGDAAAPAGWTATGTGVAVARCGTGLADTTMLKYGPWSAKLTYGSSAAYLTKQLVSAAQIVNAAGLKGRWVTLACRASASVASAMQITADDGVSTTSGGASGNASYHTGDGSDEWIYVQHEVSPTATKLDVVISNLLAGSVYATAFMFCLGKITPSDWSPARWGLWTPIITQTGDLVAGATVINNSYLILPWDAIYMGVGGRATTPPAGSDILLDPQATGGSLYSTLPKIVDASDPALIVDGTLDAAHYAYRCFSAGDPFWLLNNQIGSGTAGADLTAIFRFLVPLPELDELGMC